jgi:DnaA family protein
MMPLDEERSGGQLPLPLRLDKHALFATFVAGENTAAVAHVAALAAGERRDIVWLCGPAGSGKTHLLQAACRHAGEAGLRSMYVPLEAGSGAHPDQLLGVERFGVLALDGIDAVAGNPAWEGRLFSILDDFQERRGSLLLAAKDAPAATPFTLADLASRAAGAVVYRLKALDEERQLTALMGHASRRGLELDEATARFLQARVPRGIAELCAWLDRLDRASLAAQRRLTVPFVRALLAREGPDRAPR